MRMLAWWTKMSCCLCLRFVRFVRSQSWIDQTSSPICWGFSLAWSTDLCERHGTRRLAPRWNHGEVSLVSSFVHGIFHRFWKKLLFIFFQISITIFRKNPSHLQPPTYFDASDISKLMVTWWRGLWPLWQREDWIPGLSYDLNFVRIGNV